MAAGRFAEKLSEARNEKGWSKYRLAKETGFSEAYIGQLERGSSLPSRKAVEAIARAFDIDAETMMAWAERDRLAKSLGDDAIDKLMEYQPPISTYDFNRFMGELSAYVRRVNGYPEGSSIQGLDRATLAGNVIAFLQDCKGKYPLKLLQDFLLDIYLLSDNEEFHRFYFSEDGYEVEDIRAVLRGEPRPGETARAKSLIVEMESAQRPEHMRVIEQLRQKKQSASKRTQPRQK